MKNFLFYASAIMLFHGSTLATNPIKSEISGVTIFRSGAQIKRTATVNLVIGMNDIQITNLPSGFDESSIQVSLGNEAEISSVTYKNNFNVDNENNPAIVALKSNLKELLVKLENEQLIFDTWKEEESLILANKKVSGDNSGLLNEQLVKTAELYRTRLLEVKQNILLSKRKIKDINDETEKVTRQMNEWHTKNTNQNSGEIYIVVYSKKNIASKLNLNYIDYRAGWSTNFELRLESLLKPINLINKAKIFQSTGEDWKDVSVVLSTGNPQNNILAPVIQPWFLQYLFYNTYAGQAAGGMMDKAMSQTRTANVRPEEAPDRDGIEDQTAVHENVTFLEFTLPNAVSIPSDNKGYDIKLQVNEVIADFKYYAAPNMDNRAYLLASIPEWHQYNLSSGDIKLYFEGTYIGTSYLDASSVKDTLQVSLGPDIAISIKKDKIKEYNKTKFFSNKKQITAGWEISIRNNKPSPIEIQVQEQMPLSTSSDMEIEADELSGGVLNKETGIVEWNIKLKPGEQVKKKFVYIVKIPKDRSISL